MSNPLFQAIGGRQQPNMMNEFQQFIQQMQGKDPEAMVNELLRSGKMSQQQFEQLKSQAQSFMSLLG